MSFVMFSADRPGAPALITMVVGTNGFAPDEAVLVRPEHGRKCVPIASWLDAQPLGVAWAKRGPVRIDLDVPRSLAEHLHAWGGACSKYERVFDVQPQAIDAEFEEIAKPLKRPTAPRGKQGKKT